jgi:hypothetical protein
VAKKKDRILNAAHSVFHPRRHLAGNGGWPDVVRDMLNGKLERDWTVILHCPTCTAVGVWFWMRGK